MGVPSVYQCKNGDIIDCDTERVVTEDETLGISRGLGRGNAVTKEERSEVPITQNRNLSPDNIDEDGTTPDIIDLIEEFQEGPNDQLSPVSVCVNSVWPRHVAC